MSTGTSFSDLVYTKPHWVWKRCKRHIRAPEIIYPLIEKLFKTYGPLKDASTGQPLFNRHAWKSAQGVLRTIKDGFVSDPPGVALYMRIGLDANADDLPVYFCCRGTNISEGAVHRPILHVFPTTGVGVRHSIMALCAFIMRHNFIVGTRNRTGHPYQDHFNLTLKNCLHLMLRSTQHLIPGQDVMTGWINGWLYSPTSERIGIAQVPERLRIAADMKPYVNEAMEGNPLQFLAKCQGTLYPITPIATNVEKQLFGDLKSSMESLKNNDFRTASTLWNNMYVDGKNVHYKVSMFSS